MDEVLLIDKPAGMTSFGVVARLRRVFSKRAGKKIKVGHTGTLDPFATGLMLIVVGKECRNAATYTKLDKVYEATIILGQTSTTGDPEGEVTHVSDAQPSAARVQGVIQQFTGSITQRPPIYSAIKIDGQRAYKLARDGKKIEMPERVVQVYALDVIDYTYPRVTVRARVSSGTYIRSLAADIGTALGTGAYCQQLRRTDIADYSVSRARTLADFDITD